MFTYRIMELQLLELDFNSHFSGVAEFFIRQGGIADYCAYVKIRHEDLSFGQWRYVSSILIQLEENYAHEIKECNDYYRLGDNRNIRIDGVDLWKYNQGGESAQDSTTDSFFSFTGKASSTDINQNSYIKMA